MLAAAGAVVEAQPVVGELARAELQQARGLVGERLRRHGGPAGVGRSFGRRQSAASLRLEPSLCGSAGVGAPPGRTALHSRIASSAEAKCFSTRPPVAPHELWKDLLAVEAAVELAEAGGAEVHGSPEAEAEVERVAQPHDEAQPPLPAPDTRPGHA
jgi:hypothetical protein